MLFSSYLEQEWRPALGCTEPASIAFAASKAQEIATGEIKHIHLVVDPKIYKNCYAVGIPNSQRKSGILWAVALGAYLKEEGLGLEIFQSVGPDTITSAFKLLENKKITVEIDRSKSHLWIDCLIEKTAGSGRAILSRDHTNLISLEKDGAPIWEKSDSASYAKTAIRKEVADMSLTEMIAMAKSLQTEDREKLRVGIEKNKKIAQHGCKLFPRQFVSLTSQDELAGISRMVCAGVYARMSGEGLSVMSLAGSGNKGIVVSIPIHLRTEHLAIAEENSYEALALACLITSATTYHLGTLSAVCGCSNAAGIGLAVGLVYLEGGGEKEISLAINNMVGNLSGMICDGAKIGCALKTMSSVDAAFRACSLAMCGIGIPVSDGIVARDGLDSLKNLGRLASSGMISADNEILAIMQEKLCRSL